jgi:ABC-2 type transport system ATP-binding protein
MQPVIEFDSVSKRFGRTTALDHVSLRVSPGTVCAILGANGAGKSTAIRLMLGLEDTNHGSVRVLGLNPQTHALEIRGRTGYVPDAPPLYDWMTVDEIGWFVSGFHPTGFQEEYARCLRRFDLPGGQKISTLSKGTRAKVALSLAMAHRPPLLILDEPTSGLDPLVRREFLESMVDVAAEGRTVLLASHQVAEVERVADDVIVLLNGRVVCHQRLDELKQSILEVTLSLPAESSPPPEMPGREVAHVAWGHDHLWLVRELDSGRLLDLCRDRQLPEPSIRQASLEDILLTLLRQSRRSEQASPVSL